MWDGLEKLVNRKRWIIHRIVHCPLDILRLKQAVVLYVFLRISQLFQKEKLVAVCQTNFSRNHAGDFFFLRKRRLFDFFLGNSVTGHVCVNSNSTQFWGLPIRRRKRYNWGRQLGIRGYKWWRWKILWRRKEGRLSGIWDDADDRCGATPFT